MCRNRRLHSHDAERLIATFPPEVFYVPPLETIQAEVARPEHGHFNMRSTTGRFSRRLA